VLGKFPWPVAVEGYAWSAGKDPALRAAAQWPVRQYEPLEEYPGLFLTFAGTQPTREAVQAFANQFGLLGSADLGEYFRATPPPPQGGESPGAEDQGAFHGGLPGHLSLWSEMRLSTPDPSGEPLSFWAGQIERMHRAVGLWKELQEGRATHEQVEKLRAAVNEQLLHTAVHLLARDPQWVGLHLDLRPLTLRGALWLQLARAVANDKKFRACQVCGKWLELSPETARTNRLFCSDACRSKSYRKRQEEARRLHAEGKTPPQIAAELGSDVKTVRGWLKKKRGE
jgi:hypothetical protein